MLLRDGGKVEFKWDYSALFILDERFQRFYKWWLLFLLLLHR